MPSVLVYAYPSILLYRLNKLEPFISTAKQKEEALQSRQLLLQSEQSVCIDNVFKFFSVELSIGFDYVFFVELLAGFAIHVII